MSGACSLELGGWQLRFPSSLTSGNRGVRRSVRPGRGGGDGLTPRPVRRVDALVWSVAARSVRFDVNHRRLIEGVNATDLDDVSPGASHPAQAQGHQVRPPGRTRGEHARQRVLGVAAGVDLQARARRWRSVPARSCTLPARTCCPSFSSTGMTAFHSRSPCWRGWGSRWSSCSSATGRTPMDIPRRRKQP